MSIFLVIVTSTFMHLPPQIAMYHEPTLEMCSAHSHSAAEELKRTSAVYSYCLDYTNKLTDGATILRVVAWAEGGLVRATQARHPSVEQCKEVSELMLKTRTIHFAPGANHPTGGTLSVSGPISYTCFFMDRT